MLTRRQFNQSVIAGSSALVLPNVSKAQQKGEQRKHYIWSKMDEDGDFELVDSHNFQVGDIILEIKYDKNFIYKYNFKHIVKAKILSTKHMSHSEICRARGDRRGLQNYFQDGIKQNHSVYWLNPDNRLQKIEPLESPSEGLFLYIHHYDNKITLEHIGWKSQSDSFIDYSPLGLEDIQSKLNSPPLS